MEGEGLINLISKEVTVDDHSISIYSALDNHLSNVCEEMRGELNVE